MAKAIAAQDRMRPVRRWLWLMAALVAVMILLGGATRLTGSGLSITEWQPLAGALPPLSEAQWLAEFDKYRTIPQSMIVNPGMTLAEFKVIFWWEWTHRLLGRLLGLVFIVPFFVFLRRGLVDRALGWKLGAIFALGGLQGIIGWWMVASGLTEQIDVSQYRLAVHLTLGSAILAAMVAVAAALGSTREGPSPPRMRATAGSILALVLVQIFLGALVAKTGAGKTFNSWPWIDGRFIPSVDALFAITPAWKNLFENVLTVQFDHRMLAYGLFFIAALHSLDMQRTGPFPAALRAAILFALLTAQSMQGVLTLVEETSIALALAHQAGAVAVLIAATLHVTALARQTDKARSRQA
jgi:cytochrome c oxidase assembly protein subunit 15